jgi:hypothetical protein
VLVTPIAVTRVIALDRFNRMGDVGQTLQRQAMTCQELVFALVDDLIDSEHATQALESH